jgi:hypothetical protein
VTARARLLGMNLVWREYPFEWVEPESFSVLRVFEGGPFEHYRGRFVFEDLGGRTRVRVSTELQTRNWFGSLIGPGKARSTVAQFIDVFRRLGSSLRGSSGNPLAAPPTSAVNQEALRAKLDRLRENDVSPGVIDRLADWIASSPDRDLARARPFALADGWKLSRDEVLRAFLLATRGGLFTLHWEVICPHCRKAEERVDSLSRLPRKGH